MASIIPSPHRIIHIPRAIETNDVDPATGNPMIADQPAVLRKAMAIVQFGRRGSSRQVMSGEFLDRTETEMHMAVADPTTYKPLDQVIIGPEFNYDVDACMAPPPTAADWVVGSGIAYWVDGDPGDDRVGPWPAYLKQFGGTVKIRRTT